MRVIALLTIFAALTFTGCGGGGGSSSQGAGNTSTESGHPSDVTSDQTLRKGKYEVPKSDLPAFEKAHPGSAKYGSPPLEIEAAPDGRLAYTAGVLIASEGNVTIEFTNPQSTSHNVAVEDSHGGKVVTETVAEGFSAVTVTLKAGEKYSFYCTIPGHRAAGMRGILKVKPRPN